VKGYEDFPVLAGVYGSLNRLKHTYQLDEINIPKKYLQATKEGIGPVIVSSGECQEIQWTGDQVDLYKLPIPLHSELDAGQFITAGVQVVKDPETGVHGLGIHRMQLKGRNKLGLWGGNEKRIIRAHLKNEDAGKPTDIAVVIGCEPSVVLGSVARVPHSHDKYDVAGALKGSPVKLVKCKTVDIEVPATAEIIIEGKILPGIREREGPFGEFTGCYSGARQAPVVEVTAVTMRQNPIYQTAFAGMPPSEDQIIMWSARTAVCFEDASRAHPEVKAVNWTVFNGNIYEIVVSIKKRMETEAWNVISQVLSGQALVKTCIVVDDDIDVFNPKEINWALATRVQWVRDLHVFPTMVGATLDPSSKLITQTSKMGIDATIPLEDDRKTYLAIKVPGSDQVTW
jgi:UbiD family decarboxylase